MNELIPFQFESHAVRAVVDEYGEPWFVGKDVAELLGYTDTVNALKQHCRGVAKHHPIPDELNRMRETRVISEPDLFRLVVNSKLPSAEKFERWVFEEVLPSIRKTGSYSMPKTRPKPKSADTKESAGLFKSLFSVAKTLGLNKNAAAISANAAVRKVMNVDVLALMDHTHLVAEDQHLYFTPTELGKRIGVSAQRFNQLLFDAGLQGSREGKWVPIESEAAGLYRVLDTGKRHSGGAMIQQIKWSEAVLPRLPSQEKVIPFPDGGVLA